MTIQPVCHYPLGLIKPVKTITAHETPLNSIFEGYISYIFLKLPTAADRYQGFAYQDVLGSYKLLETLVLYRCQLVVNAGYIIKTPLFHLVGYAPRVSFRLFQMIFLLVRHRQSRPLRLRFKVMRCVHESEGDVVMKLFIHRPRFLDIPKHDRPHEFQDDSGRCHGQTRIKTDF